MSKPVQHQRLPTQWPAREVLREKGQFWTPDWVADAMIRYVSANTDFVFDPATGRGAFLRALRRLDTPKIAFYGTDIDPTVLSDEVYNQADSTVELRDFIKNPPKRRFRAIVANPPYIRHHRLDEETKLLLKSISVQTMGFAIDGRAGYHIYFLIQALSMLESGGRLAFIMPADSCEGTFAPKLWQWIGENFCLKGVATFEQVATPFPGVDTNAVLFFLEKSPPQPQMAWVRVSQPYTTELADFVHSDFTDASLSTLSVEHRQLKEALRTGLSRPQQGEEGHRYHLHDF